MMMLRKLFLVVFSVLALACSGLAAGTRLVLVGVMSDSHCGLKHAVAGPDAAKCVIGCASKDADYVLVSDGKIYKFEKKNDFYKNFAGKNVEVVGTLTDGVIAMMNLSVVELDGDPPKNLHLYDGTVKVTGGKYTLESESKVYQIDGQAGVDVDAMLKGLVGQPADLIGTLDGDTIHLHDAQSH
jgi:hypothetical protein